jgi:hypothetical protein
MYVRGRRSKDRLLLDLRETTLTGDELSGAPGLAGYTVDALDLQRQLAMLAMARVGWPVPKD